MELAQLEALVAVDDHGTFSAAATALHLTQPALSRRIATLEAELGLPVFERVGRRVQLTEIGRAALEPARRILHERRQLLAKVEEVNRLDAGELRIAGLPSMILTHLVEPVAAFREHHPAVRIWVTGAADSSELLSLVASARCDVGIVDLPVERPHLRTVPLGEQELMAVFPPGARLPAARKGRLPVVTRDELRAHPLVSLPAPTSSRTLIDELFAGDGGPPTIGVTTDLREMLVPLVLAGAGAALVPDRMARAAAARGAQVARVRPGVRRQVGLVMREGTPSRALATFVEHAQAAAG